MLPMRATVQAAGIQGGGLPALADGKARFVGEPVVVCVAATRAEAEDIAQSVAVDYEELPPVVDMLAAREPDAPVIHEGWDDNIVLETFTEDDFSKIADRATVVVKRIPNGPPGDEPDGGQGGLRRWMIALDQLIMWTSTQVPHPIRNGLAQFLGLQQRQVRVIAPDVGGGFGYKVVLQPEELCAAWLARHLRAPVRWIEDRREHLVSGANCREHHYHVTLHATPEGDILGLDCDVTVDAGAYSAYPFTNGLEGAMAHGNLPGPYKLDVYRCRTRTVSTNKPPLLPYRGVARPASASDGDDHRRARPRDWHRGAQDPRSEHGRRD